MKKKKKAKSLKLTVILVLGLSLVSFSTLILVIVNSAIPKMLLQSENHYMAKQIQVVEGLFTAAINHTYSMADDIGIWDKTVQFVRGDYPDFISENWPDTSPLYNYRFNFIIFKNLQGREIYAEFYDYENKRSLPIPGGFSASLDPVSRDVLALYDSPKNPLSPISELGRGGIFFHSGVPYTLAVMPIMESRADGTPAGTVILGSIVSSDYLRRLTHYDSVTFSLFPSDSPGKQQDAAEITRSSGESISASIILNDIYGKPAILQMTDNRGIYTQGRQTLFTTTLLLIGVMLIFIAVLYTIIVRLTLKPIITLSYDIGALPLHGTVDNQKYSSSREFERLCASINDMLEMLKQTNFSMTVFQSIFNGMDAYLCVTDFETDEILFMNDKMKEHFHFSDSIIGRRCWRVLQKNQKEPCRSCPKSKLKDNPYDTITAEEENPITNRIYRTTNVLIHWMDKKQALLQHRVDITDIKTTEATLKKRLEQQELMSAISQGFISSADITGLINKGLEMAGEFMNVGKILLARYNPEKQILEDAYGWYNPKQDCFHPEVTEVPFFPGAIEYDAFITHNLPYLAFNDITKMEEFKYAQSHGLKAVIGIPVHVAGSLWGMLSFDECVAPREWTESDIQLVRLIGSVISGALSRNITEEELVRMSSIVNSSPQFIAYINTQGQFEYLNQGVQAISGHSREDLSDILTILNEDAYSRVMTEIIPQVLATGKCEFELPIIRKDGKVRYLSFSTFKTDFKSLGIGVIASDITEKRELEKQLIAAKEEAEASSHAKGEFLSRMSHEMRTPMNAIIGMTSIAKSSKDPEKKETCLDKIEDASKHLLGVINDILDMSKIESGKFDLSYTEFNIERMLIRVIDVVNFRIDEKHQNLFVNLDPALPHFVIADEQRLAQVISNLLSNAVKFTPPEGKITLNAKLLKEDEDGICTILIEVVDTGIGIPKDQQENLFHSFEQADGSISRKFGGTGLGLAISKSIIELMGGEIWLESEPGQGSLFAFQVSVHRGERDQRSLLNPKINWKSIRILAVDEAPDVRVYFQAVASSLKLQFFTAATGGAAVELIGENRDKPFSIIFVDWKTLGLNALELIREIKKKNGESPVVVMVSAAEWDDIEIEARAAGAAGFIPKPLFSSLILNAITIHLGSGGLSEPDEISIKDYTGIFSKAKILLAEDIEINREIVITLLEDTGVSIDIAENGVQALEKFSRNPGMYDMIFMDIHMPEMDGFEATRRIRQMNIPEAKRIPIVAMTANVFREDIERCLDAGMNDHIGKPIDLEDIITKLKKYIPVN